MKPSAFFSRLRHIEPSPPVIPIDVGGVMERGRHLAARQLLRVSTITLVIGCLLVGTGLGARAIIERSREDGEPTTDVAPPTSPRGLRAEAAEPTAVELTWAAASDDIAVAGYTIYRDGTELDTVDGATIDYSDSSVSPETQYRYRVDAFDAAGNHSDPSNEAVAVTPARKDTQAPSTPQGLRAEASGPTEVLLTWSPSTDNVAIAGYSIFRNGEELATVDGLATTYDDLAVAGQSTYVYAVESFDAAGNRSDRSAEESVTTPPAIDDSAPGAPPRVVVTSSPKGWEVQWEPSTDDVGVAGYRVLRDGEEIGRVDGSTTSFTDTTDLCEGTYQYQVVAFDEAGNESDPASADPLIVVC
jgi:chitodextrinase